MTTDNTPEQSSSEETLSIYDLGRMLADGWFWIAGGGAAGVVAAAVYLATASPQYEAFALIQIGQMGQTAQAGQAGQGGVAPVEAPARVVERVMFPTFKSAVVKKLGWSDDARGAMYGSSLKASIAKGTDLIELRVKGLSREDAASSLRATIDYLASQHKGVAQPVIESLEAELQEISAEAKEARKTQSELERGARLQVQVAPRDRFSESVLYAQLSANDENRIRELRRKEAQYRQWISFTGKAATEAFAGPSVPEDPVSPRKLQTLMTAALGGLLLGVLVVLLRRGGQFGRNAG